MNDFNHFDKEGNAIMVDVSGKVRTSRVAKAKGSIEMSSNTIKKILAGGIRKGDVLSIAQLAGIMGAKKTSELIPLCHPLGLSSIEVKLFCVRERNTVDIFATCKVEGKTGVEMEALTAVSVAALTVYDMCKAFDKGMCIKDICLIYKSGGKSGTFKA
jgi:cyclic pyranopterin phosphate synthase